MITRHGNGAQVEGGSPGAAVEGLMIDVAAFVPGHAEFEAGHLRVGAIRQAGIAAAGVAGDGCFGLPA